MVSIDIIQDKDVIERAYTDPEGEVMKYCYVKYDGLYRFTCFQQWNISTVKQK